MCFSATASFVTSAALGGVGAVSLTKVKKKRDIALAVIPILFAIQQLFEGLIWVGLGSGWDVTVLAYSFLFFAFPFWPTFIPLASYLHETNKIAACRLRYMVGIGMVGSAYLLWVLLNQPLRVEVVEHSLQYQIAVPFQTVGIILYVAVTVGSLLLSTDRFLRWFGALVLLSAAIAWIVYEQTFTSVWCFFAATLSATLLVHFWRGKHVR